MSTTAARQEVVEFTMPIDTVHLTIVMTSGSRPTNTETLPQLLQHRDVIFAVIRDSDAADTLQRSTEPDVQSLWRRLSEQNNESFLGNIYEGLEYVRRGRYALILDSLEANYHTGRKPCDLVAIATIPVGRHYGFAARKGDHLLGEVNRSLEMLKSRTAEWRARHRKWWNSECPTADTDANSLMTGEYRDQTDRQKVRQADRQTGRQTDRQTGRRSERHKHTDRHYFPPKYLI